MIIKKHITKNSKEGISYISQNFQDDGLIISNSRVDGKNVIYFAVNEKPGNSSAKITIIDNEFTNSSAHNSDTDFKSCDANDFFNQSHAANDSNPIDVIRSTAKKIEENITTIGTKQSINLEAIENNISHDEIKNIQSTSLRTLEEIKSIIHQQNHAYLESKNQESQRINKLLDLLVNQFSLIQKSNESILAVEVASQASIKLLAHSIIELQKQTSNSISDIGDISEDFIREKNILSRKQTLGKLFFAGFVFISTLFLTPSLGKSELSHSVKFEQSDHKIHTMTVRDPIIDHGIESHESPSFSFSSIEKKGNAPNSLSSNENTALINADKYEEKLIRPLIGVKAKFDTENDDTSVAFLDEQWSIRMGLFSIKENSERLVERLRGYNFKTYTKDIILNNNNVTAVYVGPMVESQATNLRLHLAELFDINPQIERLKD